MPAESEIHLGYGGQAHFRHWWEQISRLSERQHDVVVRRQLLAIGLASQRIDRLVAKHYLHLVHRGVYAVGRRGLTKEGEWMAAVLALGPEAVISHITAGMLWKLIDLAQHFPQVTAPGNSRRRPKIITHTGVLHPEETTIRNGIPTTTVGRTLLDLAASLSEHDLERALAQADFHRYPLRPSLAALLQRHRGRRGVANLRKVLASGGYALGPTESPLEDLFLRFLDDRRLERPELNVPRNLDNYPIRPDAIWREAGIVVELDSRKAHMTTSRFESDRVRDRKLQVAGLVPVRVTKAQLVDPTSADELEADLVGLGVGRVA